MSEFADGITPTERHLTTLARSSFLRLWSYSGLYRDQGSGAASEGKELCDLLVVFGNTAIIFSDKDCRFPDIADVELAWQRWYRRAVRKSAEQIWGAERWLLSYPDRIFVDRACATRIPISLPDPAYAKVHRIVVAHDSSGLRRNHIGGSGSLVVDPSIVGDAHLLRSVDGGRRFAVGIVDSSRPYVHILDEVSLEVVLRELDTITDFIWYLERKENFIASGRLHGAYGEEDLLGFISRMSTRMMSTISSYRRERVLSYSKRDIGATFCAGRKCCESA